MTWFSLPALRADKAPQFADKAGCDAWLAGKPLANAPLMQGELADQLETLNTWGIPPRERYKILDTLRKVVFAVETDSVKRYEFRPLPLTAVEQKTFDASCRLWRELATGYLHCLRAALDGDAGVSDLATKICHRTITCLRLEQLSRYRGGSAIPASWWRLLHAVQASAEELRADATPVSDRTFAETRESTVSAHFAMAVLLHLARPFELSRSQFAAAVRWLARWREQAGVYDHVAEVQNTRSVCVDLASDDPIHLASGAPAKPRWIALDSVLGKLKRRAKALREGQTPEELRLGSGLPTDACIALLQFLHGAFQNPPQTINTSRERKREVGLAGTVEAVHRLLGGTPVNDEPEPNAISNRRIHEQIAIFGHVPKQNTAPDPTAGLTEWNVLAENATDLMLRRLPGAADTRLAARSLIALYDAKARATTLGIIRYLSTQEDGSLIAMVRTVTGDGRPFLAVGREKVTNRILNFPAVFLPAVGHINHPATVFLPDGSTSKLVRLDIADLPEGLKVGALLDRGANFERMRCE